MLALCDNSWFSSAKERLAGTVSTAMHDPMAKAKAMTAMLGYSHMFLDEKTKGRLLVLVFSISRLFQKTWFGRPRAKYSASANSPRQAFTTL